MVSPWRSSSRRRRFRLTPPSVLSERLADTIDLGGGGRDLPERQQTLRNTIAWSVDLLDDADRTTFRRLAVFRGGWTLDAVEHVVTDQGGVDMLARSSTCSNTA